VERRSFQRALGTAVETVETAIGEADVILVVLEEGVNGVTSCVVRYLEHSSANAFVAHV
jgi:hypothetical protein